MAASPGNNCRLTGISTNTPCSFGSSSWTTRLPPPESNDENPEIMEPMDKLLTAFVEQQRMKLPGTEYVPCYKIVK